MDNRELNEAVRAWLLLGLWALVIAFLTLIPGDEIPQFGFKNMDKVIHLLEFFALGFLMLDAFLKLQLDVNIGILLIFTIVLGSAYAGIGEWAQTFIPGRMPDKYDLLSDLLGLNLGAFMYLRGVRN
ncbi:MAG: VanZ family protein [Candidatus Omnitrophota bacterium]|nr:VanZ family protein [Candidatus Omnitrophota bacterium]